MLNIKQMAQKLRRILPIVLFATFIFLTSFAPSAQALPFFGSNDANDNGAANVTRPSDTTYKGRTIQADRNQDGSALNQKVRQSIENDRDGRPKTTGEWNKQARETEGKPGERLQRIGQQSAEAVKDWGTVYPSTAERSNQAVQD